MEPARLEWSAIWRTVLIVAGSAAVFGFLVPIGGALLVPAWDTLKITGNEIYRWGFWIIAWALLFIQGSWMLKNVHEAIINDMLVATAFVDVILFVVKFIIWFAFWPIADDGTRLFAITGIDVFGAVGAILIAFVAARVNQY